MSKAKFCLVCDGEHTYAELCGKCIGRGVESVSFEHVAGKGVCVNLKLNVNDFEFKSDGYFDQALNGLRKEPPENKRLS